MAASIREAQLPFFTVDSYSAPTGSGEWPNFLLALADAAAVAAETGTVFGSLIQVTGHGHFPPATAGQARFRVFESLAYGATAIVWFTYWTPNPDEEPWRWHDGLVDYATGEPTRQYSMVHEVNDAARACARFWGAGGGSNVAHFGGSLPAGADALAAHGFAAVPGLVSVRGGPVTIAWRQTAGSSRRKLLVVNRDANRPRVFDLVFEGVSSIARTFEFATATSGITTVGAAARVTLPPGGAAGLELASVSIVPGPRSP